MASSIDQGGERVFPVFVLNNELPAFDRKAFTTSELCAAAEKVCGFNSIEGAQKIGALWRIYPWKKETRQKLLIQGFVLRGVQIGVKAQNPFLVRSSSENDASDSGDQPPTTKLIIGNVPLSFSDTELIQKVKQLGVTVLSKLISERDRDEQGKLTHWKTGRRFMYIRVPDVPLPRTVEVGPFKASLYHREQKTAQRQQESECRRCLQKNHKTADCVNPIRCKQCFEDGHKAGDPLCGLVAHGATDTALSDRANEQTGPTIQEEQISETTIESTQEQVCQAESSEQNKNDSDHSVSSRSRQKKRQSQLHTYMRKGSSSVKRPRSKESSALPADKQAKVHDFNSGGSGDEESPCCASRDSWE